MDDILNRAPDCVGDTLRRTARVVSQHYDRALSPVGLNVGQFSILARLTGLERHGGSPPTLSELAAMLAMDRTTLTRALRPLEREGLIRVAPGSDRRTRVIRLRATGRRRLEVALPLWDEAQQSVLEDFGAQRWRALLKELAALTGATESI